MNMKAAFCITFALMFVGAGCAKVDTPQTAAIKYGEQLVTTTAQTADLTTMPSATNTQAVGVANKVDKSTAKKYTEQIETEQPTQNKPEDLEEIICSNGAIKCGRECWAPCPSGQIFQCPKFEGDVGSCKSPQPTPPSAPILPVPQQKMPFNNVSQNLRFLALEQYNKCVQDSKIKIDSAIAERNQIITKYNQTHEISADEQKRVLDLNSIIQSSQNKCNVYVGLMSDTGRETISVVWVSNYADQAIIRDSVGNKTYIYLSTSCTWLYGGAIINAIRDGYALDGAGNDYLLSSSGSTCKIINSKSAN